MFPEAFETRMRQLLGDEFDAFAGAYDKPRHAGLRLNPLKTDTPPDLAQFSLSKIPWAEHGYYYNTETRPGLSPYHEAGLYYLQEASAMAPAGLLDVRPGMTVLDLCAAPGGKTTQLAAALMGEGLLVCNEINPKRAKILSRNVERLGVANALVLNEHPQKLAERFPQYFDRILVDAPCSGEGMFRKEEAAVTDWSIETVQMCARRQAEILHNGAALVRPGGRLVYSTCTFAPEEDEMAVAVFLESHPEFEPEVIETPWFVPGENGSHRMWPHKLLGEGHFAAVLRKKGDEDAAFTPVSGTKLPKEWTQFAKDLQIELPAGRALMFGDTLYWAPEGTPDLAKLRVLRAGLELGTVKKGRFEPAHGLALWLKSCANVQNYRSDSIEMTKYIHGDVVPSTIRGWCLVTADGYSIGWGKGDGTVLKNHYPKGLRR